MDQITHKVRDQHWLRVIQECKASGLTRREWCQQNGISTKTFYYHQRKRAYEIISVKMNT
ncbi:hypothetical protein CXIVA_12750 [Clostridium sp. SY8519]|uniref:IS66 family insertion sequence element accessory protein TnpA n=1 Tax=Clostridium sp. (strain SY8519) TaxID=1042156 RepID=UPI0002171EAE|nr:hypothetical protein [Clostridium sp. SY8519]BAK47241.1 hypothetical protein CXIVA_12750 [Clostridium sp. SY8519]